MEYPLTRGVEKVSTAMSPQSDPQWILASGSLIMLLLMNETEIMGLCIKVDDMLLQQLIGPINLGHMKPSMDKMEDSAYQILSISHHHREGPRRKCPHDGTTASLGIVYCSL